MSLVRWGFVGLLALPVAEIAVFIMVALTIGWLWTLALFLSTSLVGILMLRHAGRAARERLRSAVGKDGIRAIHLESPSLAMLMGGFLLVLPGFITDLAGMLLLVPGVSRWAGTAVGRLFMQRRQAGRGRAVIDLPPDQWRQVDENRSDDTTAGDHGERKRGP